MPSTFIQKIIEDDLASGKHACICTRFPPEPNGFLHIGHAKSIFLNFGVAEQYGGSCNVRLDDTNPSKEDAAFVDSIVADIRWLVGFNGRVLHTSDYFPQLFDYACTLIQQGKAYVDFSSADQVRHNRGTLTKAGTPSPYRDTTSEENLRLFNAMRAGDYEEDSCVLRAKIDMASSFMCLRDPVLYRIKHQKHHRSGDRWCVYPMYDFAHCLSDAIEGITHSLCTLEFQDNRRLYDWILEALAIQPRPQQYEFSRLNITHCVLSKRALSEIVDHGHVQGWDDPRMPTIGGLRRRGYTPSAIKEFCRRIGVTRMDNLVEYEQLETCIRDELNETAPRAMVVMQPLQLIIDNYPDDHSETLSAPVHPLYPERGSRSLPFGKIIYIEQTDFREHANKHFKRLVLGKEVRLRNSYVIRATHIATNAEGETVVHCQYDPETLGAFPKDGRKVKGVIHWVGQAHQRITVHHYDYLLRQPVFDKHSSIAANLSEDSHSQTLALAEAGMDVSCAKHYQFERMGYYYADTNSNFHRTVSLR